MPSAANQDIHGSSRWNQGPWANTQDAQWQQPNGGPNWGNQRRGGPAWGDFAWGNQAQGNQTWGAPPPFWHPAGMSRPMAIAFTVLGFLFWWPVGLAILIYMLGSGRMSCFGRRNRAMYQPPDWQGAGPLSNLKSWAFGSNSPASGSSGNHAFDEYKAETLRRMEEEQKEFGAFLERLRFAKDKAEFDQFMAERRNRPPATPNSEQPSA